MRRKPLERTAAVQVLAPLSCRLVALRAVDQFGLLPFVVLLECGVLAALSPPGHMNLAGSLHVEWLKHVSAPPADHGTM
jgi:hypothetical protein